MPRGSNNNGFVAVNRQYARITRNDELARHARVLSDIRHSTKRPTIDTWLRKDHLPGQRGRFVNQSSQQKREEQAVEKANEALLRRLASIHDRKNEYYRKEYDYRNSRAPTRTARNARINRENRTLHTTLTGVKPYYKVDGWRKHASEHAVYHGRGCCAVLMG
jgi:hypothetical protein